MVADPCPMTSLLSEALVFSLVTGINLAMGRLVDIWDSIGILEDQRVERMETVKKHIEVRQWCSQLRLTLLLAYGSLNLCNAPLPSRVF